jgi:hypothetical protein
MHGMGDLTLDGFKKDIAKLKQALAERMDANKLSKTFIPASGVFYSAVTQQEEADVWRAMENQGSLDTGLVRRYTINEIRKFIIYGFSDATAFTGFNGNNPIPAGTLPYTQAQAIIRKALEDIYAKCGYIKVIILSHSLGCQIMSNYIWDAQLHHAGNIAGIDPRSIWKFFASSGDPMLDDFLHLKPLKTWYTTGCNIPIFVSGFKDVRAIDNRTQDKYYDFNWINYYDYDDVLGWPLAPLGTSFNAANPAHGRSYTDVVTDIQVNANVGVIGAITSSWNPLAHTQYWGDNDVLEALTKSLS